MGDSADDDGILPEFIFLFTLVSTYRQPNQW